MDPEKKSLNFIFPTKYVIPKSLKFSHWPSKKTEKWSYKTGVEAESEFTSLWKWVYHLVSEAWMPSEANQTFLP